MSSASFFAALKPNHRETAEIERDKLSQVYEAVFGDTMPTRDELVEAVSSVAGFQSFRVVKITVEFEDELTELASPAGASVN